MVVLPFINLGKKAQSVLGLFLLVTIFCTTAMQTAHAQSSRDLMNRINRLENEVQTLNRAIYKGEQPPAPSSFSNGSAQKTAGLEVRLQQLEGEIRDLRGTIQQQTYEIREIKNDLEMSKSDMNLRLDSLERSRAAVPSSAQNITQIPSSDAYNAPAASVEYPAQALTAPAPVEVPGGGLSASTDNAAAVYENAFALLKNEQYESAGQEFQSFLGAYPSHVLSGNAKYWLGETYYVRGEYDQAARIFAEGYQQYPQSAKTPDNLLKLGLSLSAMGKTTDACTALKELYTQFGKTPTPVVRRAEQEMSTLNCS